MAHPTLRQACLEDIPELESLLVHCGLSSLGLVEAIDDTLVAVQGEEIAGMAAFERHTGCVLVRSVAVRDAYRSRGIGEALTEATLELARAVGARRAYLLTETAERFFGSLGFEPVPRPTVPPDVLASPLVQAACSDASTCMSRAL